MCYDILTKSRRLTMVFSPARRGMMSQVWPLKRVGLRVRDLERALAYYRRLGLAIVRDQRAEGSVGLGAGELELLTLHHVPDAPVRKPHTAGLYHFAILL